SRSNATVRWTATGLPAGLSVSPVAHSTNAQVSGNLPATVKSYAVTVTATDTSTGKAATTRFSIVAAGSLTPSAPITTTTLTDIDQSGAGSECLDGGGETAGTAVTVQLCNDNPPQSWAYVPEGAPGAPAEITINGLCLGLTAGAPVLAACDQSDTTQSWRVLY